MSASTLNQPFRPGRLLGALLARRGAVMAPLSKDWQPDLDIIHQTRNLVPLLMSDAAALHILACVRAARRFGGAMAEAGVFMGGSARLICEAKHDVPLHLFDVFETLQTSNGECAKPNEAAIREHFGQVHGGQPAVERLLSPYDGVHLHPGVFPATTAGLEDERFSFVHIDLDLPESIHDALAFFRPRLAPGGIIIGDDYNDPGVRSVFANYFAGRGDTIVGLPWSQVMIIAQPT